MQSVYTFWLIIPFRGEGYIDWPVPLSASRIWANETEKYCHLVNFSLKLSLIIVSDGNAEGLDL